MIEAPVDEFVTRQAELRATMGAPVQFKVPIAPTWAGGTKINPVTSEPYDATAQRTNAPYTLITKTVLVILKQGSPLRPQSDTHDVAAGMLSGMDIILDVAAADWSELEDATEMVVNGVTYYVRESKPFSIAGKVYRYLVYGEEL